MIALPLMAAWWAYDDFARSRQTSEQWQGTIVRTYQERPFLGRRRSSANRYWEVRTSTGEDKTVRVYSRSLWSASHPGQWVSKRPGELDPNIVGNR